MRTINSIDVHNIDAKLMRANTRLLDMNLTPLTSTDMKRLAALFYKYATKSKGYNSKDVHILMYQVNNSIVVLDVVHNAVVINNKLLVSVEDLNNLLY